VKSASTPVDMKKTLVKNADGDDVDVHLYRSMIGSLMYLTTSRPDIIDLPFKLVAYTDSDYARESLDRKSTTRGCQYLGSRLISWQCKKQTVVATSTAEAEYMVAANHMDLSFRGGGSSNRHLSNTRIRRWRYNLTPAESKFNTPMLDHQHKYMMKAQVHVSRSFTISDVQTLPQKKLYRQNVKAYVEGEIVSKLSRS
nr:hypothetical protein [Tanacetum cinerariifolium]